MDGDICIYVTRSKSSDSLESKLNNNMHVTNILHSSLKLSVPVYDYIDVKHTRMMMTSKALVSSHACMRDSYTCSAYISLRVHGFCTFASEEVGSQAVHTCSIVVAEPKVSVSLLAQCFVGKWSTLCSISSFSGQKIVMLANLMRTKVAMKNIRIAILKIRTFGIYHFHNLLSFSHLHAYLSIGPRGMRFQTQRSNGGGDCSRRES
jgi:hypothetical protein